MEIVRIYALETDGKKYIIWCAEGNYEVTLESDACRFRCKRDDGGAVYVYPEPSPESIIVYDNGRGAKREFMFVDGMLIPC